MENVIKIPVDDIELEGNLVIPKKTRDLVIFAHGSGSSRYSPRNNFVAKVLNQGNLGTLLFDLLTVEEDQVYETRFNIDLLTERLVAVTNWLMKQQTTKNLNFGYFGSSTGAAAALMAAAGMGKQIKAVVARGGRPDLASDVLEKVKSPTLLIVGGYDYQVIELNQIAFELIKAEKELKIVPKATHLFEEPGTLEEVAELAKDWFKRYLSV